MSQKVEKAARQEERKAIVQAARGYAIADVVKLAPTVSVKDTLEEMSKADPAIWAMYFRRLKGHPYTFDVGGPLRKAGMSTGTTAGRPTKEALQLLLRHRPFLIQPLCDRHPHKVYKKCRQVGVSELSITEVLWFLWAHKGTKWIYTFPRDKQLTDFSATRVAEALDESPRMKHLFGVPNQTYLKRIGENSFMLLRSAWESNLGEGIDADGVTLDEKDRMKEGVDIAFRESLQSSKYGLLREVSTPSLPGRGVDAPYSVSCQWEWHVRCIKCGLEQVIDYPENVVQMKDVPVGVSELPEGTYEYRCRKDKCRGELNRVSGRWIAKYPERMNISGYWISQMMCPWIGATALMQKKIDYKYQQLWENYCLGRTSMGENLLLGPTDFEACVAGHEMVFARAPDWDDIAVGIDWGHLNWCIVTARNVHNGQRYLLNIGIFQDDEREELQSVKKIDEFIAPFEPDIIVADAGYGKDRNSYLLRKYPGKLFACWYNPSEKGSRTFQHSWSEAFSKVLVDRTMTLKNVCRMVKDHEIGLPKYDQKVALLIKHFMNLAPMREEDEDGNIYEVIQHTGDDHLVHALNYATIGAEKITGGRSNFAFDFV